MYSVVSLSWLFSYHIGVIQSSNAYIYGSWHAILQLSASTSCMEIKHVSSQGKTLVRGQRLAGCLERNRYKKSEHFEWKFHLILSTEIQRDLRYWYFFLISVLYANWWSCNCYESAARCYKYACLTTRKSHAAVSMLEFSRSGWYVFLCADLRGWIFSAEVRRGRRGRSE